MDVSKLRELQICGACVGEPYLSNLIEKAGQRGDCYHCQEMSATTSLADLAGRIDAAFKDHYARTPTDPDPFQSAMMRDKEIDYDWDRRGEKTVYAIMNAVHLHETVATDIQEILSDMFGNDEDVLSGRECEYDDEAHYEEITPSDYGWHKSWRQFEQELKTEARLFSRNAADRLEAVFGGLNSMRTLNDEPLVVEAGPDTGFKEFFRARVFQSEAALVTALKQPASELGPPPSQHASAGRMNAKGISVFYGSTASELARAEVRPPVGSQVALARFAVLRRLRLLNLTSLEQVYEKGSIFDPSYANALARAGFLRRLSGLMARPVMPDDQDFEYLTTQVIADFLATHSDLNLDGILFPSVQAGREGLNAVLFRKASRVNVLDIPPDTEISVDTYECDDADCWPNFSIKWIVPSAQKATSARGDTVTSDVFEEVDPTGRHAAVDLREVSLALDMQSISIEVINAVDYQTSAYPVRHYIWPRLETAGPSATRDNLPF